jgi:hypothetical protein
MQVPACFERMTHVSEVVFDLHRLPLAVRSKHAVVVVTTSQHQHSHYLTVTRMGWMCGNVLKDDPL